MKYTLRALALIILALALLPGASCPPREIRKERESPEKNLQVMRDALGKDDYANAYYSLSLNTRQRYSFFDFRMMLEYSIFGILIKNLLINWDVKSVKYFTEAPKGKNGDNPSQPREKARVILQHWKHPEYQKEFIFVYEDGWRIELTMAHILGVPQEDEDTLFPAPKSPRKAEPQPAKTPGGQ